jgi:hypothetical protein
LIGWQISHFLSVSRKAVGWWQRGEEEHDFIPHLQESLRPDTVLKMDFPARMITIPTMIQTAMVSIIVNLLTGADAEQSERLEYHHRECIGQQRKPDQLKQRPFP